MISIIVPFAVKYNNDVNLHNWPNQDIGYYIYNTIQCIKNINNTLDFEKEIKAKTRLLFHIATKLDDNQCGEKLALLEPMIKKHNKLIPENVKEQYTRWESENHSVYFQEVKTDIKVIPSSLSSLIPTVLALS